MKKHIPIITLATTLVAAQSVNAALFAQESFLTGGTDYALGDVVGQDVASLGYTGAYLSNGNNSVDVVADSLEYNVTGYLGSTGGALTADTSSGRRNGRILSTTYDNSSTGTIYLSFLLQIDDTAGGNSYRAFELHNGGFADNPDRTFQLGFHNGDFGTTGYGFRVAGDNDFQGALSARNTDVNLFVLEIDFSDQANSDSITVYQNPTGAPTQGVTVSGFDLEFDRTTLGRFGGSAITADEIRLGTTFESVTGFAVPEPSSTALLGLGGLAFILRRRK